MFEQPISLTPIEKCTPIDGQKDMEDDLLETGWKWENVDKATFPTI